mgnify:CR=1 FL=1
MIQIEIDLEEGEVTVRDPRQGTTSMDLEPNERTLAKALRAIANEM